MKFKNTSLLLCLAFFTQGCTAFHASVSSNLQILNLNSKPKQYQLHIKHSGTYYTKNLRLKPLTLDSEQRTGLMHQNYLPENSGVILSYHKEANRGIWMKNMLIPIDVLFFNANGRPTRLIKSLKPCSPNTPQCPSYFAANTKYIIETRSGFIKQNGITKNNTVLLLD